ncbi:AAA family ATPase [Candidatus Parcubacteria bacterium]|nr:AAA family ATPase [Candidatus Parcubacteria bacterium]
MNKIIIGLTGKMASGKGEIASYLQTHHNATTYQFSTILRDILDRLHKDISRSSMQNLSTTLRQNFGENILASVIAEDVKKNENNIIVVDGIRRMADVKYLTDIEGFKLTAVMANDKIRFERLVARNQNTGDDKKTFEKFLEDEKKEADREIPIVIKKANTKITNNDSLKKLHKQIEDLIK